MNRFPDKSFARLAIGAGIVLGLVCHAGAESSLRAVPSLVAQARKGTTPTPEQSRSNAQRIKEWQALLRDPDATVRLSALNDLLNSDDPAFREIAYEAGFSSADRGMRALALRARVLSSTALTFEIELLEDATNQERSYWQQLGGRVSTPVSRVDAKSGEFVTRWGSARVVGPGLVLQGGCSGQLDLGDGAVVAGTVSCSGYRARWATRLN